MKAILLPFLSFETPSALPTARRAVTKKVSTAATLPITDRPVTGDAPSRQQYVVLLALACLYPILALVGCWLLLEVVQQFLTDYFSQIDAVTLSGPR